MKDFLTLNEVADIMGVSVKTLRNWIFEKRFPIVFVKFNGVIRVRRSALENFLKRNEVNQKINSIIQNQKEGKSL